MTLRSRRRQKLSPVPMRIERKGQTDLFKQSIEELKDLDELHEINPYDYMTQQDSNAFEELLVQRDEMEHLKRRSRKQERQLIDIQRALTRFQTI